MPFICSKYFPTLIISTSTPNVAFFVFFILFYVYSPPSIYPLPLCLNFLFLHSLSLSTIYMYPFSSYNLFVCPLEFLFSPFILCLAIHSIYLLHIPISVYLSIYSFLLHSLPLSTFVLFHLFTSFIYTLYSLLLSSPSIYFSVFFLFSFTSIHSLCRLICPLPPISSSILFFFAFFLYPGFVHHLENLQIVKFWDFLFQAWNSLKNVFFFLERPGKILEF